MDIKNTIEEEIEVITLDKALSGLNIDKIDVIKMDIEGFEIDAVKGMKNTIKRYHPKLKIATYYEYYNAIRVKIFATKFLKITSVRYMVA